METLATPAEFVWTIPVRETFEERVEHSPIHQYFGYYKLDDALRLGGLNRKGRVLLHEILSIRGNYGRFLNKDQFERCAYDVRVLMHIREVHPSDEQILERLTIFVCDRWVYDLGSSVPSHAHFREILNNRQTNYQTSSNQSLLHDH